LTAQNAETASAPSDAEWERARRIVRANWAEGDVIRTAPLWADQARTGMYDYSFNLAHEIEDEELYSYNRLWVISDAEHADAALDGLPPTYRLTESWRPAPRTAVFLVDIPEPTHVLFDPVAQISQAIVTRDYGDYQETCDTFAENGWHCGMIDPYQRVTAQEIEVGHSLRRCIWVGMVPDADLRINYRDTPLGRSIRGNVGNTMGAVRADRGSDIDFRVEIDGVTAFERVIPKWDRPFHPFEIDTRSMVGTEHELTFVFHAADFYDRWLCFRARVLR
jgi:hypothetical protein